MHIQYTYLYNRHDVISRLFIQGVFESNDEIITLIDLMICSPISTEGEPIPSPQQRYKTVAAYQLSNTCLVMSFTRDARY